MAITWEQDFFQACSFRRMLMNHKNFHFTQIPDKTNDVILLKSPKTMFLGYFWPFLVILPYRDFFQKTRLSHITRYRPLHVKFQKKLMSKFWENLQRDGWTDGRTDGPYFIGPFWSNKGFFILASFSRIVIKFWSILKSKLFATSYI